MKTTITALTFLTLAVAGSAQADVKATAQAGQSSAKAAKPMLLVVSGATAISAAEKASVDGMCGCPPPPPPPCPTTPEPTPTASKPGYGFGAPTPHYGPPGQGFTPDNTWRDARDAGLGTPKGNNLPPRAFK